MPFIGHVDTIGQFALHGWLDNAEHPDLIPYVDIVVNRRCVATIRSGLLRHDLLNAGYGKGLRSFWFNPFESLSPGPNLVEVFVSGSDHLLPNGSAVMIPDLTLGGPEFAASAEQAKSRWSHDDEDTSLTWGRLMTGDSFLDQVDRFFTFNPGAKLFEIGPGYGRLLKTILERGYPFQEFVGLDLSQSRVDKLSAEFGNARTTFVQGACEAYRSSTRFDLVLSSATFEHLFPSMAATLDLIYEALIPGGMAFLDFICHDPALSISRAYFEDNLGKAFIRIYSEREIRIFFLNAGFEILDLVYPMVTGLDVGHNKIERSLAIVRKPRELV